jgi:hypothetical protein
MTAWQDTLETDWPAERLDEHTIQSNHEHYFIAGVI